MEIKGSSVVGNNRGYTGNVVDYGVIEATYSDISQIISISNSRHIRTIREDLLEGEGFLGETLTLDKYMEQVNKGYKYIIAKRGHPYHEVLGYACIRQGLDNEIVDTVTMYKPYRYVRHIKDFFRGIHIDTVAVKRGYEGIGVASKLYEAIQGFSHNLPITAFIATKPVKNVRSINFHKRVGFTRLGKVDLSTKNLNPYLQGYDMCSELYVHMSKELKKQIKGYANKEGVTS